MAQEDDEVDLHEGMPVATEEGASLGKLAALLVAEDEEEAEFLLVQHKGAERLVPFEAVLGVGDGDLVLDVPSEAVMELFPKIASGSEPTEDEMDLAYRVYEEHATAVDEDEEE